MYRAAAVIGALLLIGCGSDRAAPPTVVSSSQAVTTSTTTTSTTTTTTAPTTSTPPLTPAASPSEAATMFVNAWRDGDRAAAAAVALPAAVDAVFNAGEPGSVQNRGCNEPPQPPVLCAYKTDPGELQLRIRPQGDGWIVEQARISAA